MLGTSRCCRRGHAASVEAGRAVEPKIRESIHEKKRGTAFSCFVKRAPAESNTGVQEQEGSRRDLGCDGEQKKQRLARVGD